MALTSQIIRNRRKNRRQTQKNAWLGRVLRAFFALIALIAIFGILLTSGGIGLVARIYSSYVADLPSPNEIQTAFSAENNAFFQTTQLYDRTGQHILYEVIDPRAGDRQWLELQDIPKDFINATIAIEDRSFYENPGYDLQGITRALWQNLQGDAVQGGSTITQQLVKNVLIAPNQIAEQSYDRKIREVLLAVEVTNRYSKDEILTWYLNTNFYGNLAYGVDAAARVYFDKSANELTLSESALLAAIPQFPALNPIDTPLAAKERQVLVLQAMVNAGFISIEQGAEALQDDVLARLKSPETRFDLLAPHFSQYVMQQLLRDLPPQLLYRGGLRVTTTLDLDLYYQSECVARTQLARLNGADPAIVLPASDGSACTAANYLPPPRSSDIGVSHQVSNAAVVVIEPSSGQILSMLGSADYWNAEIDGSFNVAADGLRQPGSSFKPFVYVTAFSQGYTPSTMMLDVRKAFDSGGSTPYVPENYDRRFHGPVSMREALARSYNIPAVEAANWVGMSNVLRTAHRMGINTLNEDASHYGLALSLGGGEVTLLDMTYAYGVMANNGAMSGTARPASLVRTGYRSLDPVAILRITDSDGNLLQVCGDSKNQPCDFSQSQTQQILSPQLAYLLTDVLSDNQARTAAFGSPNPLELGRPAAAKTGTTNDFVDNWTLGYTPQRVAGVWVGNTDSTPMEKATGLTGAAPIWQAVMQYAVQSLPPAGWDAPTGMVSQAVCYPSGLLPTPICPRVVQELFVQGTQPTRTDTIWQEFQINRETGKLATIYTAPEKVEEKVFMVLPAEANDWIQASGFAQPPTEYDTLVLPSDGSQSVVRITAPQVFDYVRGIVSIRGLVGGEGLASWRVQVGAGLNPTQWTLLGADHTEAVLQESELVQWDVSALSGLYTIQLLAIRTDQRFEQITLPVTIDNITPTANLITPLAGQVVARKDESLVVQPEVTDNLSIERVELYVNGVLTETSTVAPFPMRWKLPANGNQFDVFILAVDAAGNRSRSATVTVQVTD
ncbi:MAG TPA: transglycosylase domain-containing protein [Anaerolineales bacterium]|nr:transglycosylase domain-containing protein [Anaerolineales bacterium]